MKKFFFCTILFLAIFLRFYKLGDVPASLDWDEVSLGYNAYSILLTGADEFGNSWPLSIRSFNDFKPPAYTYLDIVPTAIFGLNEFGTRFPAAFFGSLSVIGVYFLTKEFFKKSSFAYIDQLPLIAMFVFAISPWHLQFSRAAFEGGIAVFFVIWGMYFLLKWMSSRQTYSIMLSALFLAGSFYAYHAARLIVPLLLLGIVVRYRSFFIQNFKSLIIPFLLGVILTMPLIIVLTRGSASERFSSVSIFSPSTEILRPLAYEMQDVEENRHTSWIHNRRVEYIKEFIEGYTNHFKPVSMFIKGDVVERHHAPDMGLFYLIELPLIIIGILFLFKNSFNYKFIFFFWAAIAPLPAAISTGTPHAIRSILFLPIAQIAIAVGIIGVFSYLKNNKNSIKFGIIVLAVSYLINLAYYLNQYYNHMDIEYAKNWQYGYRELVYKIQSLEDQYDQIIITTAYDQPYIYFLYYKKYDPRIWVNNGEFNKFFDKYQFRKINWSQDRKLKNTLLVGEPLEIPSAEPGIIDRISFPEGKTPDDEVFRIIPSQY